MLIPSSNELKINNTTPKSPHATHKVGSDICCFSRFIWNWSKMKICFMYKGLLQKKNKAGRGQEQRGWGHTFLKTRWKIFYFTPGDSRKNKTSPSEIPQKFVTLLRNFKAYYKEPWKFKFHIIYPRSPLKFHVVFS